MTRKNLLTCFALSLFSLSAEAAMAPDFHRPFDFGLALSNSEVSLQSRATTHRLSMDRVGIRVFSLISPRFHMGFLAGSSYLNLDNDPASAGLSLNGYHAGLTLRSRWGGNPQWGVHASYVYQDTRNQRPGQAVSLSWHQWQAGVYATLILGGQLELRAGWAQHTIDARRRATGNLNETLRLEMTAPGQGELGLAWRVKHGGRVGLRLLDSPYRQVEFSFSQTFR